MLFRILVGLIGIPAGFLLLVYRAKVKDVIGDVGWAEHYLGAGGTWTAIALMGIASIVLSFMYMIGSFQTIFLNFFGRFFY